MDLPQNKLSQKDIRFIIVTQIKKKKYLALKIKTRLLPLSSMTRRKRRTGYEDEICIEFLLAERLRLYFDICLESEVMFFSPLSKAFHLKPDPPSAFERWRGGQRRPDLWPVAVQTNSTAGSCGKAHSGFRPPQLRSEPERENFPLQYFISLQVNSIVMEEV